MPAIIIGDCKDCRCLKVMLEGLERKRHLDFEE